MIPYLLPRFAGAIRAVDLAQVAAPVQIPDAFLLGRDARLSSYYIPFESVNIAARVVVVGITPGFNQWRNAVAEAQRMLGLGADDDAVLHAARLAGAFSGAIRPNLVALLDAIGVQRWLGIDSCATMFGDHAHLVQVTSVLRQPFSRTAKTTAARPT